MNPQPAFYRDLPVHHLPLHHLLGKEGAFRTVPASWSVIVVDVAGSSLAVGEGRHHDVNLAATGAIIAVLNKLRGWREEGSVPYFFGGDGATFLVPARRREELLRTLENYRHHVSRTSRLVLRVGSFPVADLAPLGGAVRLAKCQLNDHLVVPVALGNGLKLAEARIKADFVATGAGVTEAVDLEGMECRWEEVAPPRDEERVLCLIIACADEDRQAAVYREVLATIEELFGQLDRRRPISPSRLRLSLALGTVRREMRLRLGRFDFRYLVRNWLANLYGPRYFRNSPVGRAYLHKVSELSDTIMIDGAINTVIAGTDRQVSDLLAYLDELEVRGELTYGAHGTHAAVISCYVLDHDTDHLHFIDGTEGGYTAAARVYKAKLAGRG